MKIQRLKRIEIFLLLSLSFSGLSLSKIYTHEELEAFHGSLSNQAALQTFVNQYKNNTDFDLLSSVQKLRNTQNTLLEEAKLFAVLNYISQQPKSIKHQKTLESLKKIIPQSLRFHDEGSQELAVFDFSARIKGIENIWLSVEIEKRVNELFKQGDFKAAYEMISQAYESGHLATIYGVKQSIKELNPSTMEQISQDLMQTSNPELQKFAVDFALQNRDENLAFHLLTQSNLSLSQKILRHSNAFSEEFQVSALTYPFAQEKVQKFAISLMKPMVETNSEINAFLFDKLKSAEHLSSVAFALSGVKQIENFNQLKNIYFTTHSAKARQAILKALKTNLQPEAQIALHELSATGDLK